MRLTLANRVSVCVVGVVVLAIVSSVAAVWSCWRVMGLMQRTLDQNLPSVRAAEELEIAVLEQRGFVSSYLLDDGNPKWLDQLHDREASFRVWWERANATSNTDEEKRILAELEDAFLA